MKNRILATTATPAILISALLTASSGAAVVAYEFNSPGVNEGWSPAGTQVAGDNTRIDTLSARIGIDTTTGVLSSNDINIDPQLTRGAVALASGETWSTFEMRFRHLNLNPGEVGVSSQPFAGGGTLVIFNATAISRNTGGIATGPTVVGGDTFAKTLTAEGSGNWQVYTINLAGTSLAPVSFTSLRVDPIGDNPATRNFEVDYIRLTSVPEPSSAALLGLVGVGMLLRRRK